MKRNLIAVALAAALVALPGAGRAQNKPSADKPKPPDPKVLQAVFGAFSGGLPPKWNRAWIVVAEVRHKEGVRDFEVQCLYAAPGDDPVGKAVPVCDRKTVFENIWSLNTNLPSGEERRWTSATLEYFPDGKFELKYDYAKPAEAPAASKSESKTESKKK